MDMHNVMTALLTGIFATAMLDAWALTLNRALGIPAVNWALVGRWVAGITAGNFHRRPMISVPSIPLERPLGWLFHYLVGMAYALTYLLAVSLFQQTPALYSALLFGLTTVLAPWLILQPGLGLGYFASGAPKPALTRTLNLVSHLVFGFGLYLGWRFFSAIT